MMLSYTDCTACPRLCGTDRSERTGFCGIEDKIHIAVATLHNGEEPVLTGNRGSGAIFFTGCTLKCPFCQNSQISRSGIGKTVGTEEFIEICLTLETRGAANINLVTGTPHLPGLVPALAEARRRGLNIPVLWNSSGYELPEILKEADPFIDIYLPDLKTLDRTTAGKHLCCSDYPEYAEKAILYMADQKSLEFRGDDLVRGVIMRHLVLPGETESSKQVLRWFAANLKDKALLSLMFQFTPANNSGKDLARSVSRKEYEEIMTVLDETGIDEGFVQELEEQTEWFPDFTKRNPFPSGLSSVIWHYKDGFTVP